VVLALGGGALENPVTRGLLANLPRWRVVFLDAPFDTLLARCAGQPNAPVRPVLRDREKLAERWRLRLPWYTQAHVTIATANRSPELVVAAILAALGAEHDPAPAAPNGASA
jgi:shikimate kinase